MATERPLNDRMRRFGELVAGGMAAGRAYEEAGYVASGVVADAAASRLLTNVKVDAFVKELRLKSAETCEMTRIDLVQMLVDVIKSKPSDASLDNPLCELSMGAHGPYATFPPKPRYVERLCKMLGWDEPDKLEAKILVEVIKKW